MQETNIAQATCGIAYILGKMPSDIEIITDCIIEAVSCLGTDKIKQVQKIDSLDEP